MYVKLKLISDMHLKKIICLELMHVVSVEVCLSGSWDPLRTGMRLLWTECLHDAGTVHTIVHETVVERSIISRNSLREREGGGSEREREREI